MGGIGIATFGAIILYQILGWTTLNNKRRRSGPLVWRREARHYPTPSSLRSSTSSNTRSATASASSALDKNATPLWVDPSNVDIWRAAWVRSGTGISSQQNSAPGQQYRQTDQNQREIATAPLTRTAGPNAHPACRSPNSYASEYAETLDVNAAQGGRTPGNRAHPGGHAAATKHLGRAAARHGAARLCGQPDQGNREGSSETIGAGA